MTKKNVAPKKAGNVIPLKPRKKKTTAAHQVGATQPESEQEPASKVDSIADAPKATDAERAEAILEQEVERLAALPSLEYDQARKEAAKALNVRVGTLDELVERRRPRASGDGGDGRQGVAVKLEDTDPWPEPVDGEALLKEIESVIHRYVILSAEQALACALWPIHTHALEFADHSPRLHLSSPTPECGKTRLLSTVAAMVAKPLVTENITMAAMFRVVTAHQPTLLIDEADSFIRVRGQDNEEVRGLLNAGHERGGCVIRVEGDDHEPRQFPVWSAVLLASIRDIPATVETRSITINLRRKLPSEETERLPRDKTPLTDIGRRAARWVADHAEQLRDADPDLPEELGDRERDNWRPIIAIADAISADVGIRAREAARALSREARSMAPDDHALTLLTDVHDIFQRDSKQKLGSTWLADELKKLADREWPRWGRNRDGLTTTALARMLKPFGIKPRERHYDREPIREAYERYVRRTDSPAVEEPL